MIPAGTQDIIYSGKSKRLWHKEEYKKEEGEIQIMPATNGLLSDEEIEEWAHKESQVKMLGLEVLPALINLTAANQRFMEARNRQHRNPKKVDGK